MTKYVKSDIVDRPYFTAGKAYEADCGNTPDDMVFVYPDEGPIELVAVNGKPCMFLDNQDTWKWCDKEGNEL